MKVFKNYINGKGCWYQPTVILNPSQDMKIMRKAMNFLKNLEQEQTLIR